ncbi:MAG TPA: GNAT family N-acetyltransferase [Anaerolineales bacterium]|nr:GNAT family N-acetyltransferase [Anaerolineales bacterium]
MIEILIADKSRHANQIRELFWEYLQWANKRCNEEYGISFDIVAKLEEDMQHLDNFMPPGGRLLLCESEEQPAGIACLKELIPNIGEIKRMYVRPEHRNRGLGQALIDRLLMEAKQIGYDTVRLDSTRFMKNAHRMYQRAGFKEIEAYEGSEIPKEFQKYWIFMELSEL